MPSLESIEEVLLARNCSLEEVCAELAKIFGVRQTEVGILRVEGELLRFVHPSELNSAGCIPISGSAVAARTAASKSSVLHNNFVNVPHHDVFELVRLKDPRTKTEDAPRIQKLISSPIVGEKDCLLGVVQVSRKGVSPSAAGPDFTAEDVGILERVGRRVATLRPEILLTNLKKPAFKLELQNEQQKKKKTPKVPVEG